VKVKQLGRQITPKLLTAAFILCEGTLVILILTNRLVAYDVKWLFYVFILAYVVAMVLVKRSRRRRSGVS
jgi:hypothetical protein